MGAYERLRRRLLNASPQGADALRAAARRRRAIEQTGVDPAGAGPESLAAAVRQAALGGLPESGNPATRVTADAAWDRAARSGDVAPLLRARGTPVAELVADDLELQLREAMGVSFDDANVSGVNEAAFEDVQRRIIALAQAQAGTVSGDAVRVLAQRYGIDPALPASELAEQLAGGLAGQNTSLFEGAPGRVIDPRLERVSDNPFPERPSSLEGAPAANELFEPVSTPVQFRVPRYEYDALGQVKLDADGNPLPRIDPETGLPTFESVSRRQLLPYRTVDGQQFPVDAGEFTTIGRRRNSSDGNRSPESIAFVLNRGDGTYQLTDSNLQSRIVGQDELGRVMIDNGYGYISGPELDFTAQGPNVGEAEALGRMLFESMQPGAATTAQVSEVLQRLDELGDAYDGALLERALEVAGFQNPGDELSAGRELLGRALELAEDEPVAQAASRVRQAAQSPDPFTLVVRPPAALPGRGAGVVDAAGNAARRARNLSAGQELLTPAERAAQDVVVASGPTGGSVNDVSGPAMAEQFLGPDGQPITATANPAESIALAAPAPETFSFNPGILSGLADVSAAPAIPTGPFISPLASRMRRRQAPDLGTSSMSTDAVQGGFSLDTGTLPGAVPVTMDSSLPMPDRLDVLGGLSDVATPATPVMNFEATPGSWADRAARGTVDVGGVSDVAPIDAGDAELARRQFAELSNREAAARAILRQFPGWEFTDDLGEIFRRMDVARAAEPAFAELDATEQFQMVSMGNEDLGALSADLASEASATLNPNFLTQSQSVSGPGRGAVFSTDQNLPPIQLGTERAARVRQARGDTAPASAEAPADGGSPPSETAFGFGMGNLEPDYAPPPSFDDLRMQIEDARRVERLLATAERLYETPKDGLPRTPEMVTSSIVGSKDFFDLPQSTQDAVRTVLQSPDQATAMANETIERAKLLSRQLEQAERAAPRQPRRPQVTAPPLADPPDNVTDIAGARQAAGEELAESEANADFLASQRANTGEDPSVSLTQFRSNVRRILGLERGDELPLAFRDYDSRFGRRISATDTQRLSDVDARIRKYDAMTDAEYGELRARNTDLPKRRSAHVKALSTEYKRLVRLIGSDTVQDAGSTGENQVRLVQALLSDNLQKRLNALRELFSVEGVRNASGERAGEDGLQVLRILANDPAYGSVENVLHDVLSRNQAIRNPELSRAPVVDESGASLSDRLRDQPSDGRLPRRGWAGVVDEDGVSRTNTNTGVPVDVGLGPESLREVSRRLAADVVLAEGRRLTQAELNEAFDMGGLRPGAAPQWLPDGWGAPTPPDASPETPVRPSFIDQLRGYLPMFRQPPEPPPGPQVVTRQGLDTAEQELAAASTPEEMNAVLARINHVRDRALAALDDASDPPAPMVGRRGDADGVLSPPISAESSARQAIIDRADELTEAWRRRMEQMQAAESSPVAGTVDSPVDPADPDEPPVARAARQAQAERATFVPRGVSAEFMARRAAEQAARQPQPLRNPANMSVLLPADQSEVVRNALNTRQQQLESLDRRIAELESDPAAGSAEDARWGRATADDLRRERARIAVPVGVRDPRTGEVRIQLANDGEEIAGLLAKPTETDGELVPPVLKAGFIAIDFDSTGAPVLRERPGWAPAWANVTDRRGKDVVFSDSPPARRAAPEPAAEPAAEPAPARSDQEIIEEFSKPLEDDLPYDSDELDVNPDEARIASDIETSLTEPVPGPGRRRATEEYEAEQARKAGKGGRRPMLTRGRVTGAVLGAGAMYGAGTGVQTGLTSLGVLGGASGLGLAPTSAAYGDEMEPISGTEDINTLAEPVGSQVRKASRRLRYLTSQNPLPY